MNKDKRIETQRKIIFSLQEENENLNNRIEELEFQLQYEKEMKSNSFEETKKLLAEANEYREKYQECVDGLNNAKSKYLEATKQMNEERKRYKKTFDNLLKTIKKNT